MNTKSICVLNCSNVKRIQIESDEYVDHREGPFWEGSKVLKKFISWHSLSACLGTEFFVFGKPGWEGALKYPCVLLLVHRDLEEVLPIVQKLKTMRKKVFISFHENLATFLNYVDQTDGQFAFQYRKLVQLAGNQSCLGRGNETFFSGVADLKCEGLNHAYPFDEWMHAFSIPVEDRRGILIGTRTMHNWQPRNSLAALMKAQILWMDEPITFLNEDGSQWPARLGGTQVTVLPGPLSYENWLRLIGQHQVVYHEDVCGTFGQVAGDAALVGVPCVGGNSDVNMESGLTLEDMFKPKHEMDARVEQALNRVQSRFSWEQVREDIQAMFND